MDMNKINELKSRAAQGDAEAQLELGFCYGDGIGVKQDGSEAAAWFRRAAGQGNAEAQYRFGLCCYNGVGVKRDRDGAIMWYGKAADQGHEDARKALRKHALVVKDIQLVEKGLLLLEGKGVARDVPEAVKCFCEAANDGNVRAIIKVFDLDETGDAEVRSAIMQYADDTLKQRLAFFREHNKTQPVKKTND